MGNEVAKVNPVIGRLKEVLSAQTVQAQFENILRENAPAFIASVIDLVGSETALQECDPNRIVMECLKAATLKLPINKQLGFAFIVAYKGEPQMQIGYKGYIQLAMRTGQYRILNAGIVYEGVQVHRSLLTGEVKFSGEPTSQVAQGYFTHMELLNGFSKTCYMTRAEIEKHAERFSKSWGKEKSTWKTNFDAMALKTTTRLLLTHYGILSVEMLTAFSDHDDEVTDWEGTVESEIAREANGPIIDVDPAGTTEPDKPKGPGF